MSYESKGIFHLSIHVYLTIFDRSINKDLEEGLIVKDKDVMEVRLMHCELI